MLKKLFQFQSLETLKVSPLFLTPLSPLFLTPFPVSVLALVLVLESLKPVVLVVFEVVFEVEGGIPLSSLQLSFIS